MSADQIIQFHFLKIASLIASKNMEIATATMEITKYGEWRCDHQAIINQIDAEIEKNEIEAGKVYP